MARVGGHGTGTAVTAAPVAAEPSPLARDRQAYRRSRARRSTAVALLSTVVFAAAAGYGLTSSPGWPRVRDTFFDVDVAWSSLPAILRGLWLNIRVLVVAEIGILVLGLTIAVLRTLRGPVFFPVRALATGYVDLFRGVPLLIALYLIGFGLPALRAEGGAPRPAQRTPAAVMPMSTSVPRWRADTSASGTHSALSVLPPSSKRRSPPTTSPV